MEYRCRLGTAGGQLIDGVYAAENEAQLRRDFEEKGMLVLSVRPAGLLAGLVPAFGRRRRIRSRDFLEFNQELATLLKAGMPLVQSLDLLRLGLADPVLKPVLDTVYERVKGGVQLSDAFDEQGDLVPRVYTASLLAGERSGTLEIVLRRYVAYAKLIGAVRRKTISALMYPLVLLGLAVIVVAIIVLKLVPAFSLFYSSFGAELPTSTRVIMRVSTFVREYAPLLVVGLVAGVAAAVSWGRRPVHRQKLDHAMLGVPWVGDIARKFATSQMARTLATLLSGGIPLVQALDVASRSVSNRYIAHELESMAQRVREGESLAGTMRSRRIFPDVAVKMTEVGEATGALQDMLNSLADFYDEDLQSSLDRFVTLVEPVLLIILGLVIASLLLALYLPLFQLSSVVH
jgi:type IV pilus assembly protein PilC